MVLVEKIRTHEVTIKKIDNNGKYLVSRTYPIYDCKLPINEILKRHVKSIDNGLLEDRKGG